MAQKRSLPRICIALGLPDVPTLLEQRGIETEAGETFLEFRLDFSQSAGQRLRRHPGIPADEFPEVIVLATCRRHQRIADASTRQHRRATGGARSRYSRMARTPSMKSSVESAEAARDKLHQFNGRAHVIVSYHNFEATPPLDPIVNIACHANPARFV